ncbi:AIR carboxylase [Crateriforma conspicua]|uniref:AIR carboxylase n=2 Tax=Crateriforma conspicua TaxID=2527996 RepID=A0A5C5Y591_9PLAN|nr:AIR carboxylase [Crateriforma conspicua]
MTGLATGHGFHFRVHPSPASWYPIGATGRPRTLPCPRFIAKATVIMSDSTPLPADLIRQLEQLAAGNASVDEVTDWIRAAGGPECLASPADHLRSIDGATVDLGRRDRCGFGEVIFGEGKSAELITRIIQTQLDAQQHALVTRLDNTTAAQVRRCFEHAFYNPLAHTLRVGQLECPAAQQLDIEQVDQIPHVGVITAGSTDQHVAEEAIETLFWMGIPFRRFDDIGVAGPARLMASVPQLQKADALVVVAGMEGALPSVVSGHVAVPVFAVPTSVGYGANLGGLTPLMGMLSSCTANVAVVNVDAGFKGGYLAGLVVSRIQHATTQASG